MLNLNLHLDSAIDFLKPAIDDYYKSRVRIQSALPHFVQKHLGIRVHEVVLQDLQDTLIGTKYERLFVLSATSDKVCNMHGSREELMLTSKFAAL